MSDHLFDRATQLQPQGDNTFLGHASEDYWAFVGPFGGTSAGVMLRAVMDHPARIGEPLALTVNYAAPLAKGPFEVIAKPARTNRSTQHWSLELRQGDEVVLTGTAVTAERRESWTHAPAVLPRVPQPNEMPEYRMQSGGPEWVKRYEFRFVEGAPRMGEVSAASPADTRSKLWMRDAPPRPLDHSALAAMSDAFFARIFHALGAMTPFGTVSITTYFTGSADEIARQGDRHLLGVADARRFYRSYFDQSVELWSADGVLLATGMQVCYFKA